VELQSPYGVHLESMGEGKVYALAIIFLGQPYFPLNGLDPLFGATSGTVSTDAVLVGLMAMVSDGPGSVVPEVPARRHRVRGCSEAGGAQ
jgi:hypothetical protein